ncbi:MAG: crossover junction endodeoxyribonuclease RuvC [Elusimicrobia bacterium]|nr:crossover junction endodeoxyribonuclease RuvC [Elusimicrobiota bacterium]
MIIIGIDPGLTRTGWAVVSADRGAEPRLIAAGLLSTDPAAGITDRLRRLHAGLAGILAERRPDAAAAEQMFFLKASPSVRDTLQARGVILLALAQGCPVVAEYDPRTVKAALTGSGASGKLQMQKMVQRLLGLAEPLRPDDVADAAAVALCHGRMGRVGGLRVVDRIGAGHP